MGRTRYEIERANGPVTAVGGYVCIIEVYVIRAPKGSSATVIHPQTRATTAAAEAAGIYNDIRRKGSYLYIPSTPGSVRGDEAPPYTTTMRKGPRPR